MQQNGYCKWSWIWVKQAGVQNVDLVIYHTKFKYWGSNMQAISAMKKEFPSANGDGKIFTVWLKLDLFITNLQFTDQISLLSWKHYFYLNIWMSKQKKHQK